MGDLSDLAGGLVLEDLPGDLILCCLEFGDTKMAVTFAATSQAMRRLVTTREGNLLWESLISRRWTGYSTMPRELRPKCFKDEYQSRISSPRVGDCVEVLWQGKFYSHTLGEHGTRGFEGKAWWKASIVGREPEAGTNNFYYRAHFPGWEAKWDEWITRSQIRWPKPLDHNSEYEVDIGDHVEILLESTRVPSVWMEGEVKKVTIDIDGIELYLVTGMKQPKNIWVRRDRLRLLAKRPQEQKACVPCFPSIFSGTCGLHNGYRHPEEQNVEGRQCALM
eukprot:CAMPEP_0167749654 /NCGR_PEP_ID=MMETSP0110_2-20121227/5535_1 /TAXON_ID=629695 /ORGANISM="Gymnochlora sp., Strain CCMP2014" /LENGTH=277 /DNA_ID=CAMNT_0007634847 /DNA_START=9 /DNA_END=842 /DNA_ORIENTATION=+